MIMIGGTDVELWVRDHSEAVDMIFRTARLHWPHSVFENADDAELRFMRPTGLGLPKPSGREFFIYRNEEAARSWSEHGGIPENANTMLYVILGERLKAEVGLKSLTLVCTELTGEMCEIISELRTGLEDLNSNFSPPYELEAA
jgi:hypothetical protein